MSVETLEDLDWCLVQLEKMHTHRSVSDMATTKFKRILSRELNQFSETGSSASEVSEYINSTFLDKHKEDQLPSETDANEYHVTHVTSSDGARLSGSSSSSNNNNQEFEYMNINKILQHASDWSFDIFRLADVTNDRPLLILTSYLFQKHNLLKALNISSTLLHNFINSVEQNYNRKNPYHNNIHAADVLQTIYFLTQTPSIKDSLTDMDLIATFVAAAIHDVDHPGVTNQYLVNSELDLAILYNDRSVLENHHLAVGFTILKDRGVNIFRNIPSAVYRSVRRMIIDMVLATDMSMHLKLVADLKTTLETQKVIVADAKASKSASSPQPTLLSSSSSSSSVHTIHADSDNGVKKLTLENLEVKKQVFQNLIHCADLGNPCKPLPIYQTWVERVMKEFFNQGDMEKQQGLDVSPMCNRDMISVEKAQVGFIDYIALPLWEAWDELVSNQCQEALDNLLFNRDWYDAEEKAKQNNQIS
ncbi:hypothetical protein HELRODRAFT_107672 [Helobdella robusta]|uniref:Phosphodiesterase n=1 Tax=Helobdella robusta TaxID=6412 RepID=T1EEC2_HELRO|nr:hypothetical protein HELRODRAFT_107672 [Helobdella robusta]ESN96772.1 hypothetical protein HELRODRAFT_107672 [Helobdella robusta]